MAYWLINGAYVLIALSYLVKDILWLRILAVAAASFGVVYGALGGGLAFVVWNGLFGFINLVQILLLYNEKRNVQLSSAERELFDVLFKDSLTPVQFMKLLRVAEWRTAAEGEVLIQQGESVRHLMLVQSGVIVIERNGHAVATLEDGAFIGEMSFMTGRPASATVRTASTTRLLVWSQDDLRQLLVLNPTIRIAFNTILGTDMAGKLVVR